MVWWCGGLLDRHRKQIGQSILPCPCLTRSCPIGPLMPRPKRARQTLLGLRNSVTHRDSKGKKRTKASAFWFYICVCVLVFLSVGIVSIILLYYITLYYITLCVYIGIYGGKFIAFQISVNFGYGTPPPPPPPSPPAAAAATSERLVSSTAARQLHSSRS